MGNFLVPNSFDPTPPHGPWKSPYGSVDDAIVVEDVPYGDGRNYAAVKQELSTLIREPSEKQMEIIRRIYREQT